MHMLSIRIRVGAMVTGLALLVFSGWANADPPSRVARLGAMAGAVSFSPAGESDWVQATVNRPLTNGDRLWADANGRTELQVGGTMIRMGANTGISVLNLDDRIAQLQLTEGTLNVRVSRLAPNQAVEVDTPNLAFTLRQPGEYRIAVDPDGNATDIVLRKGQGEAYGEGTAYLLDTRQAYRFSGTGLRNYQYLVAQPPDDFDRWSRARDRVYDRSLSARYVSPDVIGYQDLDANGDWRNDPGYGQVWVPNRVAANWSPYRDGHWAWVDPWGWTWIDDAPWGFAVSHYGRWTRLADTWAWVPGPVRTPAWYAPALVVFVGDSNLQLTITSGNVGGIAWFPLAPRELYRPSYVASSAYVENLNRGNTVVNTTVINNTYNTTNITNTTIVNPVVYANRRVPGAVIAVPASTFVQSQPVARAVIQATPVMLAGAPLATTAPVAPTERSVHGPAVPGGKPPQRVFERPVVAHSTPPAAHPGFAAQQPQLAARPGQPLDDAARQALKPAAAGLVAAVTVLAQAQAAAPIKAPPPPPQRALSASASVPALAPIPAPAPTAPTPLQAASRAPATPVATPPPRTAEPRVAVPPAAPAAPPAPGQRATAPLAPPPPIAAPTSAARPPAAVQAVAKPEPAQAAKQGAPGRPTTAPVPVPAPPPQRAADLRPAAPQVVAPAPVTQAPPPRPAPPKAVPPQPTAAPEPTTPAARPAPPPAPQPARVTKPEPAPVAKPPELRTPAVATKPPPPPAAQAQSAPKAEPRAQQPGPAASKPRESDKDREERKREEEQYKPKG